MIRHEKLNYYWHRLLKRKDIVLAPAAEEKQSLLSLLQWAGRLARPYKKWIFIILLSMLIETLAGLATPWPLKIIIDNIVGQHALPGWLSWLEFARHSDSKLQLAAIAAVFFVVITAIGSLAGYLENYYNESVAQYVANDLRQKMYHHLQLLSLSYYDSHQTGK